jgi:hypothetical protein
MPRKPALQGCTKSWLDQLDLLPFNLAADP